MTRNAIVIFHRLFPGVAIPGGVSHHHSRVGGKRVLSIAMWNEPRGAL